ncbi:MAG TPA: hypothetical protein VNO52_06320 [Methylomirabilota bacterium]|nr:hypothetical protein [Methylomirabilota bacterium]
MAIDRGRPAGYMNGMACDPSPRHDASAARHAAWARAVTWIAIVGIVTAAGLYVFKSLRDLPGEALENVGQTVRRTGEALATVASAFHHGTVTTSFLSYATRLSGQQHFQFATLRQMEVFTQSDQRTTGFGYIPLPEVIVEARAPVEFTYYLDLNAPWRFELRDGVLHVFAPPIRFNQPAVDASAIQYEIRKGSLFRDTAEAMENLKQAITMLTRLRARENIRLVRETGRRQTAEFIERWLARQFADGAQYPVKVYFPGEAPQELTPLLTNAPAR